MSVAPALSVQGLCAQQAPVPAARPDAIPEGAPAGMAAIDATDLSAHAAHLASDRLGGRFTASSGQLAAAAYVAEHFERLGLRPLGDPGEDGEPGWLQRWPVEKTYLDVDSTSIRIGDHEFTQGFGVLPAPRPGRVDVEGRLLFCGYGAPDALPEQLDGAIPVVLLRTRDRRGQPVEAQFMLGLRTFSKCRSIARRLARAGAECVLFCELNDASGVGALLNYIGVLPDKPSLKYRSDAGMAGMLPNLRSPMPLAFLSSRLSEAVLDALNVEVGEDGAVAQTAPPEAASGRVRIAVERDPDAHAVNVVGLLPGADETLGREAVVYSAHIDHMGTRMDGDVFNGADDNASGTAALLEIAEAFATGDRPRRSVVFLAVSGEEEGLWGSHWFSEHPTWPLEGIVANVNIDMIGRATELSGADEISVTPSYRHDKFSSIARTAARLAEPFGLDLTIGDKFYSRSDHVNFARKGIPVVFFCDGEHEDYHQVTDTADKLDIAKMTRVTRLAYWVGDVVANDSARPREIGRQRGWLGGR